MNMSVYMITHVPSGKRYIGATWGDSTPVSRFRTHMAGGGSVEIKRLMEAGFAESDFILEVIFDSHSKAESLRLEESCIRVFGTLIPGGLNRNVGGYDFASRVENGACPLADYIPNHPSRRTRDDFYAFLENPGAVSKWAEPYLDRFMGRNCQISLDVLWNFFRRFRVGGGVPFGGYGLDSRGAGGHCPFLPSSKEVERYTLRPELVSLRISLKTRGKEVNSCQGWLRGREIFKDRMARKEFTEKEQEWASKRSEDARRQWASKTASEVEKQTGAGLSAMNAMTFICDRCGKAMNKGNFKRYGHQDGTCKIGKSEEGDAGWAREGLRPDHKEPTQLFDLFGVGG